MAGRKVIVIGGGMAGMSCAAMAAEHNDVTVLEAEDAPGYHSSGRSAASYIEPYINATICALTTASRGFFEAPPAGFTEAPLVTPRTGLLIAAAAKSAQVDRYLAEWSTLCPKLRELDAAEALAAVPILAPDAVARAVLDPDVFDIDVHGLLSGFTRLLKARGGNVVTRSRVDSLARVGGVWRVGAGAQQFTADVVVNAAGAWGDELARLAGASPVGLVPKRRTAVLVRCADHDVTHWPIVHEVDNEFYFKPDAGRLLLSPADQTPSAPCDAQPEELDIAIAVERFERATSMPVTRIEHRWAGLRSFVADSVPVVGFDSRIDGFFWLVGQGGFGIQTSPTMGRLSAALLRGAGIPGDLAARGLQVQLFAPSRFN
jgi:D-arginine dehydrogenase